MRFLCLMSSARIWSCRESSIRVRERESARLGAGESHAPGMRRLATGNVSVLIRKGLVSARAWALAAGETGSVLALAGGGVVLALTSGRGLGLLVLAGLLSGRRRRGSRSRERALALAAASSTVAIISLTAAVPAERVVEASLLAACLLLLGIPMRRSPGSAPASPRRRRHPR